MLMLLEGRKDLIRDKGTILGRSLIGLLFLVSGLGILLSENGISGTAGFYESIGIPLAGIVVWIVVAVKIVAGGAIIVGKRVFEASASLIAFTLLATIAAHMDFSDQMQLTQALKNLAIVGGLMYLMAYGPGGTNTHSLASTNTESN